MPTDPLPPLDKLDPAHEWQPWVPDAKGPWNLKWAGHLYRRAAFGGTLDELRQAERRGLPATLDLLLKGGPGAELGLSIIETGGKKFTDRDTEQNMRGWWVWGMLYGDHPLREKMTLFWHNHFATSNAKVRNAKLMVRQNLLLRRHALGKFGPFLLAMSKDPAMLIWLDSNSNVKGKPNENYAREVMELFSLGVGNYTEKDVREAARAFTGWHQDEEEGFAFNAALHDNGAKTVLGKTGNLNGDDVVRILLEQPAAARFLVRKLYHFFISESREPPDRLLEPLAEALRKSDYDIAALVRTMLASRHFFSGYAYRQRIKSPVEFVLGAVRAVHRNPDENDMKNNLPPDVLVPKIDAMGQPLFSPPNVKGWRGGRAWLNTSTVVARQNFAQEVAVGTLWRNRGGQVGGFAPSVAVAPKRPGGKPAPPPDLPEEPAPPRAFDPARVVHDEKLTRPEDVVRLLLDVHLPGGVGPTAREKLVAFMAKGKPSGAALDRRAREVVHAILTMPEYQMA